MCGGGWGLGMWIWGCIETCVVCVWCVWCVYGFSLCDVVVCYILYTQLDIQYTHTLSPPHTHKKQQHR